MRLLGYILLFFLIAFGLLSYARIADFVASSFLEITNRLVDDVNASLANATGNRTIINGSVVNMENDVRQYLFLLDVALFVGLIALLIAFFIYTRRR